MSSQTAAALEAARTGPRNQKTWNSEGVFTLAMSWITSLLTVAMFSHLAGRSLAEFVSFGIAMFGATIFAQQYHSAQDSPMRIDVTVRIVRSFFAASAIVLLSCAAAPRVSVAVLKSFLLFSLLLTLSRVFLRVRSTTTVVFEDYTNLPSDRGYATFKRLVDVIVAALVLLILSPILLLVAIAVAIDSRGSIVFCHQRVGYQGRPFRIFKFRSMHISAPQYQRSPTDAHDPRITRVGRVIRRLSLDEVPQLVNVLRGEMSLVGPRPEMPFIVREYSDVHRRRLNAVPGITGLWQISPARALPIHHNMEYDLYYIARQSLLLDLAILIRTAGSVIRGIGAA